MAKNVDTVSDSLIAEEDMMECGSTICTTDMVDRSTMREIFLKEPGKKMS